MIDSDIVYRLIIPPKEAEQLVASAVHVYLRDCPCRAQVQACPHEKWEVCLVFADASEESLAQAHLITADEAVQIIQLTTGRGDIHQLFYYQDGLRPYELCNCCTCCCDPLREAKEKGDYDRQLHSAYIAVTDCQLCAHCGSCLESCFFEARELDENGIHLIDDRCFGCGRCLLSCPQTAIRLEVQAGRGVPIPSVIILGAN